MAVEENPFAAPREESESGESEGGEFEELERATQGARFVNLIGDTGCRFVLSTVTGFFLPIGQVYVTIFSWLGYYLVFEWLFGKTPAKWFTNTRVVTIEGTRPTFWQILGRSLARYVPFEPLSFFGGRHPVGWHDRWSNTRVVKDER